MMKAIINGITIEGTPQEIMEYQRMQTEQAKQGNQPKQMPMDTGYNPWLYKPSVTSITMGEPTMYPSKSCNYPCNCTGACHGSNLHKMTESFNILSKYSQKWDEKAP